MSGCHLIEVLSDLTCLANWKLLHRRNPWTSRRSKLEQTKRLAPRWITHLGANNSSKDVAGKAKEASTADGELFNHQNPSSFDRAYWQTDKPVHSQLVASRHWRHRLRRRSLARVQRLSQLNHLLSLTPRWTMVRRWAPTATRSPKVRELLGVDAKIQVTLTQHILQVCKEWMSKQRISCLLSSTRWHEQRTSGNARWREVWWHWMARTYSLAKQTENSSGTDRCSWRSRCEHPFRLLINQDAPILCNIFGASH